MKRKGVVTRKEGNHYYIRYYGDSISNKAGFDGQIGESLIIQGDEDLEVGDFVESEYFEKSNLFPNHHGFGECCEKFKPTAEDIQANEMLQKYLDEVAKQAGLFFKDILTISQAEFRKDSTLNPMHILLSEEEVLSLIQKYTQSIQTYGINGASGSAAFVIQTQLGVNNLFDKPGQIYQDILGVDTSPFMKMQLPSCLSSDFTNNICHGNADIGNPKGGFFGNGAYYYVNYDGLPLFRVSITKDGVASIPYEVGKVAQAIKRADKDKMKDEIGENDGLGDGH